MRPTRRPDLWDKLGANPDWLSSWDQIVDFIEQPPPHCAVCDEPLEGADERVIYCSTRCMSKQQSQKFRQNHSPVTSNRTTSYYDSAGWSTDRWKDY